MMRFFFLLLHFMAKVFHKSIIVRKGLGKLSKNPKYHQVESKTLWHHVFSERQKNANFSDFFAVEQKCRKSQDRIQFWWQFMFCTRACSSRRIDGETETKINKAKSSRELNCKSGAFEVRSAALKLRQFQVKPLLAPLFGHNLGDPSLLPISLPEAEERGRKRTVLLSRVPKFRPVEFYWKESTLRYDFPVHPMWSLWSRTKRAGNLLRAFYMNTCVHFPVLMRYNRFHFLHVTTFSHVLINAP